MKTRILIGLAAIFLATTATAAPWGGERCQNVRAKNLDACMKMVAAFNRVDAWLQQFTKGGFDGAETDIEVQVAARFLWATVAQKCMLHYSISEPMPVKLDELGDCLETQQKVEERLGNVLPAKSED